MRSTSAAKPVRGVGDGRLAAVAQRAVVYRRVWRVADAERPNPQPDDRGARGVTTGLLEARAAALGNAHDGVQREAEWYGASEPFHLAPGEYRAGVVRVQRPGTVTGHVLDALGKPVAGYRVSLRNYDVNTGEQTDGGWRNVPTGRDGRFAFVGVAPGGHKLENNDHEERACVSEVFDVRPGATVDVTLRLQL